VLTPVSDSHRPWQLSFTRHGRVTRVRSSASWGRCVKPLHWMIVVFGMCVISISSIELRSDNSETPYDESEIPSLIALVSVNKVVRSLTVCVSHSIRMFRPHRERELIYAISKIWATCLSQSRLSLLSKTLLC